MHQFTNQQVSKLLQEMAAVHEVKGEGRFKVAAYQNAADSIEHLSSDVYDFWQEGHLAEIPAVGKSIASYLDELFRTGEVKHFQESKKEVPEGFFVILGLPGIGPKTAYKISKEFKIKSIEELKKLAEEHKLSNLPGFGQKSEEEILKGIDEFERRSDRLLLPVADHLAQAVIQKLKEELKKRKQEGLIEEIEPLGSLRRMVATIGDIDLAVSSPQADKVIEAFVSLPSVARELEKGPRKASVILKNGRRVDLMVELPETWGSLLQHFTGSKLHNIHLRKVALDRGMSLSEYGIKGGGQFSEDTLMKYGKEEDFYQALGMSYIPPEMREDQGEIEAALVHKLPHLVELSDIKGDLHLHSSFPIEPSHDLGSASMDEIIKKARELNYQYLAFSEHSPALSTHKSREADELVRKRNLAIDQLKFGTVPKKGSDPKLGSDPKTGRRQAIEILKAMEVDILTDGRLSLSDDVLEELDLVLIGVHSSHHQNREVMTKRILRALENPLVNVLTHPTGRLLLQRESFDADWHSIFEICAKRHIALEINAHPVRLDLPDTLVREAKEKGVKFVVNTDAHSLPEMDNMRYGVAVARRGWCEKEDILNSWSLQKMLEWFKKKRV